MTTKQAQTKAMAAMQAEAKAAQTKAMGAMGAMGAEAKAAEIEAVERSDEMAGLLKHVVAHLDEGESQPTRRKFNRGSTRRISRAVASFQAACDEFAKELDLQIYMADADGNRTGPAPIVENIKEMRAAISVEVERAVQPAE
jgi:hypothetical protein